MEIRSRHFFCLMLETPNGSVRRQMLLIKTRWPFVFCNRKLKAPFLLLPAGNCELPAPTKTCRREWVNHYATLSIYFLPDFTFFLFLLLFIRLIVCWLCTLFHFNEALRSYCFCGDRLSNEFPNLIIIRIFRLILFDCPSYVGIYCLVEINIVC